ncbi:MAG TPA: histidine--tRNA ligase [Candidatus Woesearchaeota archaeon]|nr:histidine--tRNA ligase [Candidatus Woesearchaeota archaeon]
MKLSLPKGMKDSLPQDMIRKQRMIDRLKGIFELYGFSPLDTPAIERLDVLSAKYAGGAEILKETFKLSDQGGRDLGLRYDLTVPFARVVGMNPSLKMPFKRYQIDKVWRDGPVGAGRYREFLQCDVDVVGVKQMPADAEILAIAKRAFDAFGLECKICVNSRKILNGILESIGIERNKDEIILAIDKLEKESRSEIEKELSGLGMNESQVFKLFDLFSLKGTNKEKIGMLKEEITSESGKEGIRELEELFGLLDAYGIKNYVFEPSLSRGLSFYTGTVFEVFLPESKIRSSVAAGGRYDRIISQFLESKKEFPCVGISFGLSRIYDAIEDRQEEARGTVTDIFIIPIGIGNEALAIAEKLRDAGVKTEVDLSGRGVSKNLDYANTQGIPFVAFIGEEEIKSKKLKLKDMKTGKEQMFGVDKIDEIKKIVLG